MTSQNVIVTQMALNTLLCFMYKVSAIAFADLLVLPNRRFGSTISAFSLGRETVPFNVQFGYSGSKHVSTHVC